jgi:hypothetical protein
MWVAAHLLVDAAIATCESDDIARLSFGIWDMRFGVSGLSFSVQGLGFRV